MFLEIKLHVCTYKLTYYICLSNICTFGCTIVFEETFGM